MLSTTSKIKNTTELGSEQKKGVLDSPGKLMIVPKGSYRKIAQKNWNLTDEQMKGMHVHHRILVSEGGTNDPANLYVCSPWFHYNVWHEGAKSLKITLASSCGGKANTSKQLKARQKVASERCKEWHESGANLRGRLKAMENRKTAVKLTRVETNEEFFFSSQIEAVKAFGLSKGSLCGVLRGNRTQHKGFKAEYVEKPNNRL